MEMITKEHTTVNTAFCAIAIMNGREELVRFDATKRAVDITTCGTPAPPDPRPTLFINEGMHIISCTYLSVLESSIIYR